MNHRTYVEINLDNLSKNVNNLIKKYNNYQYFIGVVKADAYGHGLLKVSEEIVKHGVNYLATSSLDDAIQIRNKMRYVSILCMEPIPLSEINTAIKNNITITISSYEYYQELITKKIKGDLKIHLNIDTGLNRYGLKEKLQIEEIIKTITDHKKIFLEGIYSELADSDNINSTYFNYQINKFLNLTKDTNLEEIPIIHLYDSGALLAHPKLKIATGARLGSCMYGINRITHKDIDLKLRPTWALYSEIIEIRKIKPEEYIGYHNNYQAKREMLVGILPIGYKDGFLKINAGRNVSINNIRHKIISDIGLDNTAIYIDHEVNLTNRVALIGEVVPIEEVADYLGLSPIEIMTNIDTSISKIYIKSNK